jgi:sodium/bile acid cotransporter 7
MPNCIISDEIASLPLDTAAVQQAAAAVALTIPDACLPGLVANLALLDGHAAVLRGESSAR